MPRYAASGAASSDEAEGVADIEADGAGLPTDLVEQPETLTTMATAASELLPSRRGVRADGRLSRVAISRSHRCTAVYRDDGSGDVRGLWAGEEADNRRDFVGAGWSSERDSLHPCAALHLREFRGHVCLGEPWCHHIHRDAARAQFT